MLATVYSMAMKAEAERAEIFAGRKRMPVIRGAWAEGLAEAIEHYANDRTAEGQAARDAALDEAPDTPGELDGVRFDWITDADARFGPTFEVIIQGRYGLVAFSELAGVQSESPKTFGTPSGTRSSLPSAKASRSRRSCRPAIRAPSGATIPQCAWGAARAGPPKQVARPVAASTCWRSPEARMSACSHCGRLLSTPA